MVFPHALFMYTVHGFASVSYTVVEAYQLTTTFGPNVKGNSPPGANIGGQIIAEEGTARMFLLLIITEINGTLYMYKVLHFLHCVPTTSIPATAIASCQDSHLFNKETLHGGESGLFYHVNDVKPETGGRENCMCELMIADYALS